MDNEDQLRDRISATWTAFRAAKGNPAQEMEAFRQYCEALDAGNRRASEAVRSASRDANAMKVALRVLGALNDRRAPEDRDLGRLREFLPEPPIGRRMRWRAR